ncbi:MAG: Holliday junction branch migration protein RuvA [Firmicutes bacterium]|nr:Holliday junction branch migration protein RuvA [Bacillota bacterium]
MFSYLSGKLVSVDKETVVLENSGIGWLLHVPASVQRSIGQTGVEVKLYTYLAVREDTLQLYGFLHPEELNLFKQLLTVSGIGPRVALGVISTFSVADFYLALLQENVKMLTQIPGVGQKTARRLIVELKEKVPALSPETMSIKPQAGDIVAGDSISDALQALLALGFQGSEAQEALQAIAGKENMTTEEIVRKVLAHMSRR